MRKLIRKLVENKFTWNILNFFYRIFYRFKFEKDLIGIEERNKEKARKEKRLKEKFSDLVVRYGPFKGMRYPDFIAMGSAMYPKLLGSYECELNDSVEELARNNYSTIVDIGCAEGYFAVGMAMRLPSATVYAFDINKEAINACKKLAETNKVFERVRFGEFCSAETLKNFDFKGRGLIICDCEGYEVELFPKETVTNLRSCDVLIEMHDLYNEKITPTIEKNFSATHDIRYVYSQNTFKKLDKHNLRGDLTDQEVLDFFTERNGIMTWAVITPKQIQ
jgi:hypothetical protein